MKTNVFKKLYLIGMFMLSYMIAYAQEVKTHIVQPGETLARIAQMYGVSESAILEANPTAKDYFFTGLKLTIPQNSNVVEEQVQQNNEAYASTEVNEVSTPPTAIKKYSMPSTTSNTLTYGPNSKMWGFTWNTSFEEFPYAVMGMSINDNLKFGKNNLNSGLFTVDVGLQLVHVFDDVFLIKGTLLPYVGLSCFENVSGTDNKGNPKKDFKTKFTYGAKFDLQVGVKIFTKSNGKDVYLTGGYQIWVDEFHTTGMFEAGSIMLGLAFVY